MAEWTDGPEYAPHDRPQAFVAPQAQPLSEAAPVAAAASASHTTAAPPPNAYSAPASAPELATLVPPPPLQRDPREAFDVAGTPLTSWSGGPREASEVTAERRPEDPFTKSTALVDGVAPPEPSWPAPQRADGRPPPGRVDAWPPPAAVPAPQQPGPGALPYAPQAQSPYVPVAAGPYAPVPLPGQQPGYPGQPWQGQQQPFRSVGLGDIARAVTPGVLICLVVGLLVQPLAAALLLVAWALSTRIRYRRRVVLGTFGGVTFAVLVASLLDMLATSGRFDLFSLPEYANVWAGFANIGLLIAVPLIVGEAMRRGEQPEQLP